MKNDMNERIQELSEQATSRPHRSQGFGEEPTHIYPGTLDQEKFAELIIKECASICLDMKYTNPQPHHYAVMIKEHFGVEE